MNNFKQTLSVVLSYRTELMGFAAFWIVLLHVFSELYPDLKVPVFYIFIERGNLGVDIFLLLSGAGLYYSQSKNTDVKQFYSHRIQRVVIPWLILSLPYWVYISFNENESLISFLLNLTGLSFWLNGKSTTWYVSLILLLYLVYPFIFKIQKKMGVRIVLMLLALLIAVNIVICLLAPGYYGKVDMALARIPAFLLGNVFGELSKSDLEKVSHDVYGIGLYSFISIVCFVLSPFVACIDKPFGTMLYFIGGAGVVMVLMTMIAFLFHKCGLPIIRDCFSFLGRISLELYLVHVFIRNIVAIHEIGKSANDAIKYLIMTIITLISIVLAYGFSSLRNIMKKRGLSK